MVVTVLGWEASCGELHAAGSWCVYEHCQQGWRGQGRVYLGEVEGCDDPPEPVAESLEQTETH